MNYVLSLLIGIISSLVATGLFIAISELFRRVLLPWFADKIYRGVRIDGEWNFQQSLESGTLFSTLTLIQRGDKISGTYSHGTEEKSEKNVTAYSVQGSLRDTYLTLTAYPESKYMMDALSFMLKIYHEKSLAMKGMILYISTETGTIKCDDNVSFTRKEA